MEFTKYRPNIEKSAEFEGHNFGIKETSIILDIVRNRMYSNPIKAIVQELGTNARDANVEAGRQDSPIEIKLPNTLDPSFYIRDHGIGIDPERVKTIFVNYGSSTKRKDNVQDGGFGLGAKTPFAYGDSFAVDTYIPDNNGKMIHRNYIAYIDETNLGRMDLVGQEECSEKQGTKISLPVKPGDFDTFKEYVQSVYKYWTVRPKILGVKEFQWDKVEKIAEGTKWFIVNDNANKYDQYGRYNYSYGNKTHSMSVLLNKIPYPLTVNSLPQDIRNKYSNILSCTSLVLEFDTGEIQISATREEIDYRDATIKSITKRLDDVIKETGKVISDKIKGAKTIIEAYVLYSQLKSEFGQFVPGAEWRGNKIKSTTLTFDHYNSPLTLYSVNKDNYNASGVRVGRSYSSISFGGDPVIYYDDTGNQQPSIPRCATLVDKYPNRTIYIIEPKHDADPKELKKTIDKTQNDYGINILTDIEKFSTVDLKKINYQTANTNKSKTVMTRVFKLDQDSWNYKKLWTKADKDLKNDSGIYVYYYGKAAYKDEEHKEIIRSTEIERIQNLLNITVYAIPPKFKKRIGKNWTFFYDYLEQEKNKLAANQIEQFYVERESLSKFNISSALQLCLQKLKYKPYLEYQDKLKEIKKHEKELHAYDMLLDNTEKSKVLQKKKSEINDSIVELKQIVKIDDFIDFGKSNSSLNNPDLEEFVAWKINSIQNNKNKKGKI